MKKYILILICLLSLNLFSQDCILCNKKDLIDIGATYHETTEDGNILYIKRLEYGYWMYSYNSQRDVVLVQLLNITEKVYVLAMAEILNENKVKVSSNQWLDYIAGLPVSIDLKFDNGYYFLYSITK